MPANAHTATNQSIDPAIIAAIVGKVIMRIRQTSQPTVTDATAASVDDKIVTVATIDQLTGTPSQLFIDAKAIVTPAARDAASDRGIVITRSVSLPPAQRPKPIESTSQEIIDIQHPERAIAVAAQLARRGIASLGGTRVVLSETPAADVFDFCQRKRERAVMVTTIHDVDRFERELKPTIWVLDMKRLNLIAAVNIAARIAT
ncbi:MAG: hypothetical protein HKN47_01100 [Pirellulaceae bacterium]|nr:hypothetical protein [Pirellulaceae bacterium]